MKLTAAPGPTSGEVHAEGPPLRLAVLGDSSAAGFGAPDHASALAGQFATALAALLGRRVSWRVSARGGATAGTALDLVSALETPEVVLLVVGVNDTTRLRWPPTYQRAVATLIAAVRAHLGHPVPILLAGLPPVGRFPAIPTPVRQILGAHARRLDHRLARLATHLPDVHHLPVGTLPLDHPGLFAPDGFHPAPPAYQLWGRLLAAQSADLIPTPKTAPKTAPKTGPAAGTLPADLTGGPAAAAPR
ncbi:SGNH/GDSL hydrolase family protein [Actinoplanes sp. HUAS TT8]|uniref:SGNH/GDSL hydrolase family protein n=1 Tax=Actinoplanes sp. HUAS TT8 TaxID=3447453 RepID=UPI003F524662